MEINELKKNIEALLLVSNNPISIKRFKDVLDEDNTNILAALKELQNDYEKNNSALQIIEIADGWQLSTKKEYAPLIKKFFKEDLTLKLSKPALEVLAIIAYKQPITKSEIEIVRGVDSTSPLQSLLEKKIITIVGRKDSPGRPLLYSTTQKFLKDFGLKSINDMPRFEEIQPSNQQDSVGVVTTNKYKTNL